MDVQDRLDVLLLLCEELDIQVRGEWLDGEGGGLCTLRGRRVLFVDNSADLETRYERTLGSLAPLEELDNLYIRPEVRDDIDSHRLRSGR